MGKITLFRKDSDEPIAPQQEVVEQPSFIEEFKDDFIQEEQKIVHVIKEVIVEKPVEVIKEVEKIVEKEVEVIKEVIVEKPVHIIKEIPVEVEKIVEKEVQVIKEVEKKVLEQVYKVPTWVYIVMAIEALLIIIRGIK